MDQSTELFQYVNSSKSQSSQAWYNSVIYSGTIPYYLGCQVTQPQILDQSTELFQYVNSSKSQSSQAWYNSAIYSWTLPYYLGCQETQPQILDQSTELFQYVNSSKSQSSQAWYKSVIYSGTIPYYLGCLRYWISLQNWFSMWTAVNPNHHKHDITVSFTLELPLIILDVK